MDQDHDRVFKRYGSFLVYLGSCMMYSRQLKWLSSPRISASTNTVRTVLGSGKPSTEPFAIDLIKVVFPVRWKADVMVIIL